MKFLILGCNGMVGHMVSLYLKEMGYEVEGYARKKSNYIHTIVGDARDSKLLEDIIRTGNYTNIVNCIGLLNESAENDRESAVYLNAYLPHFLEKITNGMRTQIIHISTDCVFSGSRGNYTELDFPDGKSFYDRSKALGELTNQKDVTLRMSVIGPDINENGIGLINWFLKQKGSVNGYSNVFWTGLTTLQLAKTIENVANQGVNGLYNMVPEKISKYNLLVLFNKYLRSDSIEIVKEENYKIDKSLKRTNFERFTYKMPEYEQQIKELGEWMREHNWLYPQYKL